MFLMYNRNQNWCFRAFLFLSPELWTPIRLDNWGENTEKGLGANLDEIFFFTLGKCFSLIHSALVLCSFLHAPPRAFLSLLKQLISNKYGLEFIHLMETGSFVTSIFFF